MLPGLRHNGGQCLAITTPGTKSFGDSCATGRDWKENGRVLTGVADQDSAITSLSNETAMRVG
jgi:hypothetical protein